jgi:ubiquitin-protein ligase
VSELAKMIESVASCHAHFPNASELHHFNLTIRPTDGIYADGSFNFVIDIPIEYNIVVSYQLIDR